LPLLAPLALAVFDPSVRGKAWRGPRRLLSLPSLLLFGLLAFAWFAHEIARRPDLLGYLVGDEVVARVGSGAFDRNPGWRGWLRAYGPVLLAGMLPWWPLALWGARRRRRAGDDPGGGRVAAARLLAASVLLPLAAFTLSQSRQPLYLLPLAIPAALLIARQLGPIGLSPRGRAAVVGWAACLLALKGLAAVWPTPRDGRRFATELLARLPYPPGELLFVEERARYSLALYLDCEIERIDLESIELRPREPSYRPLDEKLAEELAEPEPARVYLVPFRAEAAFEREVSALGRRSRRVGELDRFAIHLDPLPEP
jgi:hypothetical protein